MFSDDLVPLLAPPPMPGLGFRQGVVVAWNTNTGANTINVAGELLSNVPMLNTGEAVALKPGHVVGLLTWLSSWFILGRITIPGDPDFASASVAFGGEGISATNFGLTTTPTVKVTDTMAVPDWADEAIVLCTVNCSISNPTAALDFAQIQAFIDGSGGGGAGKGFAAAGNASFNDVGTMAASAQRRITNPGSTITFEAKIWTAAGAAWGAVGTNIVNLDAIGIFRSTV